MGPTGGYIIGFVFIALLFIIAEKLCDKVWVKAVSLIIGLFICYLFGSLWFYHVMKMGEVEYGFGKIMMLCVLPYIIPDVIKLICAFLISSKVKKIIKEE